MLLFSRCKFFVYFVKAFGSVASTMESVNCLFVLTILVLAPRALCESGDTVTTTTEDVRSGHDVTESSVADEPAARGWQEFVCKSLSCSRGTRCVVKQTFGSAECVRVCPCLNGGVCRRNFGSTYCDCSSSYSGDLCDRPRRGNCSPNACGNGVCLPPGSRSKCRCPSPPYFGTHCKRRELQRQRVVDHCRSNPCLNGGVCTASSQSYNCSCNRGFYGTQCENGMQMADPCLRSNPCSNDCKCVASCRHASGYYCRGENGYLGKNCTIPPPSIQCRPNQVIVTVDDSFLREYDLGVGNSVLHMAHAADDLVTEDCLASTANGIAHTFVVHLPFTKCGTTVEEDGEKTVVTNNIWLNRATAGGYDMPVPVICFECTYGKEYVVVTSLRPAVDQPQILRNTGIQRAQGVIELCKVSSSCPSSCPSVYAVSEGAVYTVGEWIHLNIGGDRSRELAQGVVALKTLYLSCDGHSGSAAIVQLVTNGCAGGSRNNMPAKVTHSGQSAPICASFQVPRLQGCTVFFIHAEVETCGLAGCTYNPASCSGQQPGFGGRKRRALHLDKYPDIVDVMDPIPIYVIDGSYGAARAYMFPNTSTVDSFALIDDISNVADGPGHGIVIGLSVLCLIIVLAVASIAGICFRESLFPGK